MPQDTSIPITLIKSLQVTYTSFLEEKQKTGLGVSTEWHTKQMLRTQYIENINLSFESLIRRQAARHWESLLCLFVDYRINLYTENYFPFQKLQSDFGDALRAVQMHLLKTLADAHTQNPNSYMLNKLLVSAETEANSDLNSLQSTDDVLKIDQIKRRAAAFGNNNALDSYHLGLAADSVQMQRFSSELMNKFPKNQVSPLRLNSIFQEEKIEADADLESSKRQRRDSGSSSVSCVYPA